MEDDTKWIRIHRLLDPEDIVRDQDLNGDAVRRHAVRPRPITKDDFDQRVDDADRERQFEE